MKKDYSIYLENTTEPTRIIKHHLIIEFDEEEIDVWIEETIHDVHNSDFDFDDISDASLIAKEIGFESAEELLEECIAIIYKNVG